VNSEIARRLADGDPVLLFGEGTSSDGNRVLAFRTALIGSARDAITEAGHIQADMDSAAVGRLHGHARTSARLPEPVPRGLVWSNVFVAASAAISSTAAP